MGWVVLGLIAAIAVYLIMTYNGLVAMRQRVNQAFADIDVQLKQRHDLIPNLVETVKGYAAQEREVLTAVIEARAKASQVKVDASTINDPAKFKEFQDAQNQLTGALGRLLVTVERYPELKSNQNFLALQSQLEGTENRISVARRDYNEAVRQYNVEIRTFPSIIAAKTIYGATPKEPFKATAANAEQAPQVKF